MLIKVIQGKNKQAWYHYWQMLTSKKREKNLKKSQESPSENY